MRFACQAGASVHGAHSSLFMKISTTDGTDGTDKTWTRADGTSVYPCHRYNRWFVVLDAAKGSLAVGPACRAGPVPPGRRDLHQIRPLRRRSICCGRSHSDIELTVVQRRRFFIPPLPALRPAATSP